MTKKILDKKNRWRSRTIGFRVSPQEGERLDEMVRISGLTKQEYIMKRLECKDIVVRGCPRIYKKLKDLLKEIKEDLEEKETVDDEVCETIQIIAKVIKEINESKGENND